MKVSIIIPAHNEEENIKLLINKFDELISGSKLDYEVIIVDDGSSDNTYSLACELQKGYRFLKTIRHNRKCGITDALVSGFDVAEGEVFVYFPADLQYLPEAIPELIKKIEEGYDIATGWKHGKYEKKIVSYIYNAFSRKMFNIPVHDLNSIKAFKKELVNKIPFRKDWHRYIVVMAWSKGFNVSEVKVNVYPRKYGKSKCGGVSRVVIGMLDLIAVKFQISFMQKPMLFFGSIGGILTLSAMLVGIYALYLRYVKEHGYRPLLWLVIFLGLSGLLLFISGFLAEAIAGIQDELRELRKNLKK